MSLLAASLFRFSPSLPRFHRFSFAPLKMSLLKGQQNGCRVVVLVVCAAIVICISSLSTALNWQLMHLTGIDYDYVIIYYEVGGALNSD